MSAIGPRLRGAVFYALFYLLMGLMGLAFFVPAMLSEGAARWAAKRFFALTFLLLRLICGVRIVLRGTVPTGPVIVAAKHQSMLDVFILFHALPVPRFVMKRELLRAPVFGWYARRVGVVAIDRAAGPEARAQMVRELTDPQRAGGQMVIYPQGTRVPPGQAAPYRAGIHAVYETTSLPVVLAATNTGCIQPKGLAVYPGTAVVEFLPEPVPPGLRRDAFMARIEAEIEAASDRLADG